jgi:protein-tyrosine phosphatase
MNGFTDIHTHILPCVDDGAQTVAEGLKLVQMAWENGTRTIILTPHYRGVFKKNTPEQLRERFEMFRALVCEQFPGMNLYLGQEAYYQVTVPERLADGVVLSMNDSQYALIEFSGGARRSQVVTGISETIRNGFVPIIAHMERYEVFRKDWTLVEETLEMGAMIQLNADSVMGKHGLGIKWFCGKLLKRKLAHFIASDAHDTEKRPPLLRKCFLYIHKKYGAEYAAQLFYHNAQAVIENSTM